MAKKMYIGVGGDNLFSSVDNVGKSNIGVTYSHDSATGEYTLNGTTTSNGDLLLESNIPLNWLVGERYTVTITQTGGLAIMGEGSGITYSFSIFSMDNSKYMRNGNLSVEQFPGQLSFTGSAIAESGGTGFKFYLQLWRPGTIFKDYKFKVEIRKEGIARQVKKIYVGKHEELEVLNYIESTGTQYIDTDCYADSSFEWEMDFQFTEIGTSQWSGSGETLNASTAINMYDYFRVGANLDNNSSKWQSTITSIPADTERHTLHFKSGSQKIDGVQVTDYVFNPTNKGTLSFLIGAFHTLWENTVQISNYCKMKVYSSKIYQNNVLIRDFVPIKTNTGIICLYDKITKKKFYNQGTGTFIAGEKTGEIITLENKARKVKRGYVGVKETYKVLDYIESSGTQYIDTEITADVTNLIVEIDGMFLSGDGYYIAGAYDGSTYYGLRPASETQLAWHPGVKSITFTYENYVGVRLLYKFNKGDLYINDELTADGEAKVVNRTLYLFGRNGATTADALATCRIYSCKMYQDNVLVRDLIPIQTSEGIVCLYDKVSKKKFYNKGTGSFIAGEETGEVLEFSRARLFFSSVLYPKYKKMFTTNANNYAYSTVTHTKDYIIVAGGKTSSSDTPNKKVYAYDKNTVEYSVTDLTTQAGNGGAMSISNYAIVAGGFTASSWANRTNQVIAYDNSLSKTTLSALTDSVFEPACASNEIHCICMAGSIYSSESTKAQSYNRDLVKTSISASSCSRRSKTGAGVGKYLVFCGSQSSSGKTDFYDNSNVKTSASNPYSKVCTFPLGVSTNKYAMFFGGATSDSVSNSFNDIKAYDENLVSLTSSMPTALYKMNGFTVKGQFVVVGRTSTIYVYDENLVLRETITLGSSIGYSNSYLGASTNDFGIIRGGWVNNSILFEF